MVSKEQTSHTLILKLSRKREHLKFLPIRGVEKPLTHCFAIYKCLSAKGYTMVTAVAKLLSYGIVLVIHAALPTKVFGCKIQKLSPSYFSNCKRSRHLGLLIQLVIYGAMELSYCTHFAKKGLDIDV